MGTRVAGGWYTRRCPAGEDPMTYEMPLAREFKANSVRTLPEVFSYIASKFGDKTSLGTRQLIRRQVETAPGGRALEKLELGDYEWLSYKQVQQGISNVGKGLRDMGYKFGDRVAIFAETRAEFLMAALGSLQERVCICTVYTSLSDEGIIHAVNETETPLVFTSQGLLQRLIGLLPSCPLIKTIVVMEDPIDEIDVSKMPSNITMIPFKQLLSTGEQSKLEVSQVQDPEDIAIIMYTSGSTGTPKGVQITHTNAISFIHIYVSQIPVDPSARYLAFLPMAHIMELVIQISILTCGAHVYYSSPSTLTTSSSKIATGTLGDVKLARPTRMSCVPLVLHSIIKNVMQTVEQQGWLKSFVFKKLLNNKSWIDYIPITSSLIDYVIFKKIKDELGGCLEAIVVASAPISAQTHYVFEAMFGCKILIGYGATETAGSVSSYHERTTGYGHTGPPNYGVLVKLIDWDEGGYRTSDKPNPRGEVVVAGDCITKGYFKRPEETAKAFYIDNGVRAFRTGDIGEIDEQGCLKIIDRKKDLVKLRHGEYVSLAHVESVMKTHPLVENICVFGDSLRDRTVFILVPSPRALLALAETKTARTGTNPSLDNMSHLYTDGEVSRAVLRELQAHCRDCGLNKWETPAGVHLTADVWDPDSGLVTGAMKLRRTQIGERYREAIAGLYRQLD